MNSYNSPGKNTARELVVAVASAECQTVLDFYGGGRSARAFAEAGLIVTSAEIDRDLWPSLEWDAVVYGYEAFEGRASRIKRSFDFVFADFTGGPSPRTRRELRKLSAMSSKWLAVTLCPDRQLDETVTGPSSAATVPAWLIEATGMRLEYIGRYIRNEYKQWMWIALLMPRGVRPTMVDPLTIAREIQKRRYWASDRFRRRFVELVPHRSHTSTTRESQRQHERYANNLEANRARGRANYHANREKRLGQIREWQAANPAALKAAQTRWRDKHKNDPEYKAKQRARSRAWYLANRDKAIEQARQSRLRKKAA